MRAATCGTASSATHDRESPHKHAIACRIGMGESFSKPSGYRAMATTGQTTIS